MKTIVLFGVLLMVCGGFAGCASDGGGDDDGTSATCAAGSTQACTCQNGDHGAQTCAGEAWGQCVCDGTPLCTAGMTQACVCADGSDGAQTCAGEAWGECQCTTPTGPKVGDPCQFAENCSGGEVPLICVLENPGDIQGICTVVCSDFSDCTSAKIGQPFWDCCDLTNGSFACTPSDWTCG